MSLTRRHAVGRLGAMSRRLVASCLAAAVFATASCGSDDEAPAAQPQATTAATASSIAEPSATPSAPEPLGPITPSGRPTATVPPSPVAEIGAGCLTPGDGARKLTFPAPSGATLHGAIFGRGRAGVVLAHQSNGDLCQWLPYATD